MASFGTKKTHSLLDIPEELILHIFSYLTDHVVHFQVRNVCRKLKVLAEHHLYLRVLIFSIILVLFYHFSILVFVSGESSPASIPQS